ncbi:MAG: MaoC/PaaZ C-terminal domain-containing protein [Xanthobacteraceae bacterium]
MALNYERVMAYQTGDVAVSYGARDCILYALGIGLGMDPVDSGQLQFVYERNLQAFPTLATVLGWFRPPHGSQFGVDERLVVHAEQKLTLHSVLPIQGKLTSRARVKDVIDKGPGKAAIIQFARELVAPDGTLVASIDSSTLARQHGGFGGRSTSTVEPAPVPDRLPDQVCSLPTPPNLALLFRLNGDDNPLHADPDHAKAVGFPRPILHGMASFGIAAHAVLRAAAAYRPERLKSIEARFVRPVFPGETLSTEMWVDGAQVLFRCRAAERDEIVLDNGRAALR